jgi:hypothetical protein
MYSIIPIATAEINVRNDQAEYLWVAASALSQFGQKLRRSKVVNLKSRVVNKPEE